MRPSGAQQEALSVPAKREHEGADPHAQREANSGLSDINERKHRASLLSVERMCVGGFAFRGVASHGLTDQPP